MKLYACFLVLLAGTTLSPTTGQTQPNLLELAENLGANTLVSLIQAAGLNETIANGGPFTIFAPSDAAFAKVPASIIQTLKQNISLLTDVLKYHVISGDILSTDLINDFTMPTLLPYRKVRVNMYQNNTIVTITGSKVVKVDQMASNGVIHVLDSVMYPIPDESLINYAAHQPSLGQLVYNIIRADLQTVLSGDGPFTVFAPVDSAFFNLPPGYLNIIFLNKQKSQELLKYHVVSGAYYSVGLQDGQMVRTVEGNSITMHINGGKVMVNNATVTEADHTVTNGVIHIIDRVLIPSALQNIT